MLNGLIAATTSLTPSLYTCRGCACINGNPLRAGRWHLRGPIFNGGIALGGNRGLGGAFAPVDLDLIITDGGRDERAAHVADHLGDAVGRAAMLC